MAIKNHSHNESINTNKFNIEQMLDLAINAMKYAYIPYSHFSVGACIVDENGTMYSGANIENASYGLSCCAERVTIFSAAAQGVRNILAICVVGNTKDPISPCGACRQVIREFAHKDIVIILSNVEREKKLLTMEDLLPYSFGPEHLLV